MRSILVLIAMAVLVVSGCKGKDNTSVYSTPGGQVKVEKKGNGDVKELTVTSEKGTVTFRTGKGEIPKDLGVPIYPGADAEEGRTWSMKGMNKGKEGGVSSTFLHSDDGIEKVIAFYKKELEGRTPKFFEMTSPNGRMANFAIDTDAPVSINIMIAESPDKKGTQIHITRVQK